MKIVLLLLIILLVLINSILSQLTTSFDPKDIKVHIDAAKLQLKSITIDTLNDEYEAVSLLSLSSYQFDDLKCDCDSVNKLSSYLSLNKNDYKIIKRSIDISKYCGCNLKINDDVKDSLSNGLKSDNLNDFCLSAISIKTMNDNSIQLSTEKLVDKIKSLSFTTLDQATLVLEVLSKYVTEETKSSMASIAENSLKFLPKGTDSADVSEVDASLLGYIAAITVKKNGLAASRLLAIGNSLLDLKASNDPKVVGRVLSSLKVLTSYKTQPVHVSLAKKSITSSDKSLKVIVKNSLGIPLKTIEIEVKSINILGKSNNYFTGITKEGSFDLPSEVLNQPSLYQISLSIKLDGRQKPLSITLPFAVKTTFTIKDVQIATTPSKTAVSADFTSIKKQNTLSAMSAYSSSDNIHVGFKITSDATISAPHQAFVKYTHIATGISSYFVGDVSKISASEYKYKSVVALSDEIETFVRHSGPYTVTILIGDVSGKAEEWILGTMTITFPQKENKILPLYTKSLLDASDNTLNALPEIIHQNRPPSKRASYITALAFTILSLVPLFALISFFFSLKCEISLLKSPSTILFMGLLIGTVLLYLSYWLAMPGFSFYQTIYYICFLAPGTFVVGRYALKEVKEEKTRIIQAEAKKSE